jgi:heat-inducible transcriptional repressor
MCASNADTKTLSDRARGLLKALIETHISDGQPVGSRTLAKTAGLDLSPATIRNVMSDLEDLGLIASPHTSAGRVPTTAGYRLFVDSMLQMKPLTRSLVEQFRSELESAHQSQTLTESASTLLSGITQMAGVVTLPRREVAVLEQIEFVRLGKKRVLAVLVMAHGEVQNRVLLLDRDYERSELQQVANFLNEHYVGMDFIEARQSLVNELRKLRVDLNSLMESVIELGGQALDINEPHDYVLVGQTLLMDYDELSDVDKLRQLFDIFNTKNDILHILDRCAGAEGVQIFIGHESGNKVLDQCSVVSAPYSADGRVVGVLGVIGPTRMAYDRVVPIVDVTAKLLGAALNLR